MDIESRSRQKTSQSNHSDEETIDEFLLSYKGRQGGFFAKKTRERILTKKGISGRGRKKNQFWYRQRENVKTSLLDLELFVKEAGEANVNRVLTTNSLDPIIRTLFLHPVLDKMLGKAKPEPVRAKIAQLFIKEAFRYLESMGGAYITMTHQRAIEEAIDLSDHLTNQIILNSLSGAQS